MSSNVPNVKLSNGVEIPIVGLGTYKALGDEIKASVHAAIEIGYRHFDTADFYKVYIISYITFINFFYYCLCRILNH